MVKKYGILSAIILAVIITGCGVSWQKPMTKEEMLHYSTVLAFAKDRYTNVRASLGTSRWEQGETADRNYAGFVIGTSPVSFDSTVKVFLDDMAGYCDSRGGVFKDTRAENKERMKELKQKYSRQEENGLFECGPEGRGTVSRDWTKFNPTICRKLYDTKTDMGNVMAEYGRPDDFQCSVNAGVIFMGSMGSESFRSSLGPGMKLVIRLNEAKSGAITASAAGKIEMR